MKYLWQAIDKALHNDARIVQLTEDSSTDIRICVWEPEGEIKYPSLMFWEDKQEPWIKRHSHFKITQVSFGGFAQDKVLCDNILTRMEELLDQKATNQERKYWNVTSSYIWNNWTRLIGRSSIEYDDVRQAFHGIVMAEFQWFVK